jgi:hypothetical protein
LVTGGGLTGSCQTALTGQSYGVETVQTVQIGQDLVLADTADDAMRASVVGQLERFALG